MRHARQMSAEDVRRAADLAAAGARRREIPAEVIRRAADRAEERTRPKPVRQAARFTTLGDDLDDIPF